MTVRVVTDSTALLPADVVEAARMRVVPLSVTVSGQAGREGLDVTPDDVAQALGERRYTVTTRTVMPAPYLIHAPAHPRSDR